MKQITIIALALLLGACAPAYVSVSGNIPPEIQQNIAPAKSSTISYSIAIPDSLQGDMIIKPAPSWGASTNVARPIKSALTDLIENKFPAFDKKSPNEIHITVVDTKYGISRNKYNPTATSITALVTVLIITPEKTYSRRFRHKATIAIIGSPGPYFIRLEEALNGMVLSFVIDLDKFIESAKI